MARGIIIKSLLLWLAILVMAVLNGLVREYLLAPALGAVAGMVLSGVLLAGLVFVMTYLALPWLGRRSGWQWGVMGLGWLMLTLGFEFGFGLGRGLTSEVLLQAYTFRGGNLWPLVLLVTAVSPWLAARLRGYLRQGLRQGR